MQYLVCNQAICQMPRNDPDVVGLYCLRHHISRSLHPEWRRYGGTYIVPLSDTCTIAHGLCYFIRYLLPTVPVHSVKHILQSGEHTVELSMYLQYLFLL